MALCLSASPAVAQDVGSKPIRYADLATLPVPVVAGDITDHPYRVIGHIKGQVRKATIFSGTPSDAKAYREIWERGRKLGADAVIHATIGDVHLTAFSAGAVVIRGDAIKFVDR